MMDMGDLLWDLLIVLLKILAITSSSNNPHRKFLLSNLVPNILIRLRPPRALDPHQQGSLLFRKDFLLRQAIQPGRCQGFMTNNYLLILTISHIP